MPSNRPLDLAQADPTGLAGRVALVTGGTRGIGLAIAQRLAGCGASVLVCGRTQPGPLPAGIEFAAADVRDPEQALRRSSSRRRPMQ